MDRYLTGRVLLTLVCIAVGCASFFVFANVFSDVNSAFYVNMQEKLNTRFLTAASVFGITKLISGVIAFFQSIDLQAGIAVAGISFSPMEVLTPINNAIDKMSNLFLLAMGAVALQKILFTMTGWLAFKIILPLASLLFIAFVWTGKNSMRSAAMIFIVLSIATAAVIPLSIEIANVTDKLFLDDRIAEAQTNVEEKHQAMNEIKDQFSIAEQFGSEEQSKLQTLKKGISLFAIQSKIKNAVDSTMEYAKSMIADLLNMFVAMLITTLIIPILTILLLWQLMKYVMKQVLKTAVDDD